VTRLRFGHRDRAVGADVIPNQYASCCDANAGKAPIILLVRAVVPKRAAEMGNGFTNVPACLIVVESCGSRHGDERGADRPFAAAPIMGGL
jgi:hypothetical protein